MRSPQSTISAIAAFMCLSSSAYLFNENDIGLGVFVGGFFIINLVFFFINLTKGN